MSLSRFTIVRVWMLPLLSGVLGASLGALVVVWGIQSSLGQFEVANRPMAI